jgi:quercetin dioxygenase-like cupin family protein
VTVKMNGKDVEWEDPPKGDFLTDVKIKVLWRDEKTGAYFRLIKIPVGIDHELRHIHPEASHWSFIVSGEAELANGTKMTASEDNYLFMYNPKGEEHGLKGIKYTKEFVVLQYFDGPPTRVSRAYP